jgi:class 3 adenylate cyclase
VSGAAWEDARTAGRAEADSFAALRNDKQIRLRCGITTKMVRSGMTNKKQLQRRDN